MIPDLLCFRPPDGDALAPIIISTVEIFYCSIVNTERVTACLLHKF